MQVVDTVQGKGVEHCGKLTWSFGLVFESVC